MSPQSRSVSRPFAKAYGRLMPKLFIVFLSVGLLGIWSALGLKGFGVAICLAGAMSLVGGLLGFLFGIPRVLQRGGPENAADDMSAVSSNTNLERISDWLTAIIIGATLVQFQEIAAAFKSLATEVSNGFGGANSMVFAAAYFALIYFLVGGFLFGYLFTRIVLVKTFKETEEQLRLVRQELENAVTQESFLESQLVKLASIPQPAKTKGSVDGDQNKGLFGGEPRRDGYELSAKVIPIDESGNLCRVELLVRGNAAKPLEGRVSFHLHETFRPRDVIEVFAVRNEASCKVIAWGAFTVGVRIEGTGTLLELDLSEECHGGPAAWRER